MRWVVLWSTTLVASINLLLICFTLKVNALISLVIPTFIFTRRYTSYCMLIRRLFGQLSHTVVLPKPIAPLCCASLVVTHHAESARRPHYQFLQFYPSSSSTRWRARQVRDRFAKEAKVQGLKSRAAFKLLEIDSKYRIFSPGQTVID